MATTQIDLTTKNEYYMIAESNEDFTASNTSRHAVIQLVYGPSQPASSAEGHPVKPHTSFSRIAGTTERVWAKSNMPAVSVVKD